MRKVGYADAMFELVKNGTKITSIKGNCLSKKQGHIFLNNRISVNTVERLMGYLTKEEIMNDWYISEGDL